MQVRIRVKDIIFIIIGSSITAFATKYIFDQAGLVTGGVSGLSIIAKFLTGRYTGHALPLWAGSIIFNVPIFIFGMITDGKRSVLRSAISWLIITVELYLFPEYRFSADNLLLVAIYGGICYGAGTGILLMARTTSGGTDMLANSLHKYIRQVSIGRILQFLDGAVVLAGAAVFNLEHTLYAVISVFLMGKVADFILSYGRSARMALIISARNDEIAKTIMKEVDRGVTCLDGRGMYSGEPRTVLVCICTRRDIVDIKDIVRACDPNAFFVVGDVAEALGEGFLQDWSS
ncbi:MAG: YitT family protein [Lachnospiraceae bacterium]|nr:YitT family protein [Lachnospiraceae bacterium]